MTVIAEKRPRDLTSGYALCYTSPMAGYVGHVIREHDGGALLDDAFTFAHQVGATAGGMQFGLMVLPIGCRGYREERQFQIRGIVMMEWFRDMHTSQVKDWTRALGQADDARQQFLAAQAGIVMAGAMPKGVVAG